MFLKIILALLLLAGIAFYFWVKSIVNISEEEERMMNVRVYHPSELRKMEPK